MAAGTWSGTFTNEEFVGPGAYQALNGIRTFIDMATVPGPVTVTAIASPGPDSSFILEWDNPDRELLELVTADQFESLVSVNRTLVSSVTTRTRRGLVGFTFLNGRWEVFSLFQFGTRLGDVAFMGWRGRNTNGLATLLPGAFRTVEVERTAVGSYTVRVDPGVIILGETMAPTFPVASGLVNQLPLMFAEDIGVANPDEILVKTGTQNMGGVFMAMDLESPVTNFWSMALRQFP